MAKTPIHSNYIKKRSDKCAITCETLASITMARRNKGFVWDNVLNGLLKKTNVIIDTETGVNYLFFRKAMQVAFPGNSTSNASTTIRELSFSAPTKLTEDTIGPFLNDFPMETSVLFLNRT